MQIQTTRFGPLDIDPDNTLTFPRGLVGFEQARRFVLLDACTGPAEQPTFWWLQSLDRPELAFIVTDPSLFFPTYRVDLHPQQMIALGLGSVDDAQTFVIVNKRDEVLTANLQGPLVVNIHTRDASQLVLSDRKFATQARLMGIPAAVPA